jgi:putative addiction module component (TIGR02574 family)
MKIMQELSNLTIPERLSLIEEIWDSIDKESIQIPDSHKQELDRRLERHEKGEKTFGNWEDIKKDLNSMRKL